MLDHDTAQRHAQIVQQASDPIIEIDLQGYVRFINRAAEEAVGYTAAEMCGQHFLEAGVLAPDSLPIALREFALLLDGQEGRATELTVIHKDGSRKLFEGKPSLMKRAGNVEGASVICREITLRQQATEQDRQTNASLAQNKHILMSVLADLREAHEQLQVTQMQLIQAEKLESVGRLAAGVAHEVKNPLAIILQATQYLTRHIENNPQMRMVIQSIDDAVKRADTIIRGLLDFASTREVTMSPVDINAMIRGSVRFVQHTADKQHVQCHLHLTEGLPAIRIDRGKIEQVLINLFMNALYAMPAGGVLELATQVVLDGDAEQAVIIVHDSGPGIPPNQLEKVFDPFFTTKPTGEGTGLGLAVSRKIMELHNGTMLARNHPGGGAEFTLMFRLG